MDLILSVLPIVFFSLTAAVVPIQTKAPSRLASIIDGRFGPHAYEAFAVRLKPLLLLGTAVVLSSAVAILRLGWHRASPNGGLMLSGGLGFMAMHAILYRRRFAGVFPSWTLPAKERPPPPVAPLPLRPAIRAYGWTLVPLGLFPFAMFIFGALLPSAFIAVVPPFFGVTFLAMWPVLTRRATPSFWLVAMGTWGGGIVGVAVLSLVIEFARR